MIGTGIFLMSILIILSYACIIEDKKKYNKDIIESLILWVLGVMFGSVLIVFLKHINISM